MKNLRNTFLAVFIGTLTACSSSTPTMPPAGNGVQYIGEPEQTRSHSWSAGTGGGMDLLYVSDSADYGPVLVFEYPKGTLVGEITVPSGIPEGLCSDSAGDVFVTTFSGSPNQSYIYKYAHGGSAPVGTLTDPGAAQGCAVDRTTGNLAITNNFTASFGPGNVAVYPDAQGAPWLYSDPNIGTFLFCAYDDGGNLFADGDGALSELPAGGQSFRNISLNQPISPSSIQWLKKYQQLVVVDDVSSFNPYDIYQIKISGSAGSVTGPTVLKTRHDRSSPNAQFWAGDGRIIGPANIGSKAALVNFWRYPKGGRPTISIRRPGGAVNLFGVTVSRANTSGIGTQSSWHSGASAATRL